VALVLAVLVQERHPKADALTWLNSNSPTRFAIAGLNGKSSGDKTTSGQSSTVDQASTENSPKEKPSPQMEVLGFTPEINHTKARLNAFSWTPVIRQTARVIGPKIRNVKNRSSVGTGTVDVKRRLIELWHQSLAQIERSRSWTAFSNLKRGVNKKAAYTAETNH
jgi:hypothetical protein